MKKILVIGLMLLCGCYTQPFYYLRTSFSIPDRYEKIIRTNSCGGISTTLFLRESAWSDQEIPKIMDRLTKRVYDEKLYINHIYVKLAGNGDQTVIILASDTPTSHDDIWEKKRHDIHMIREEKCECRLCK